MKAEIWYLFNSGFAVKTERRFFIFDYYPMGSRPAESGLNTGFIDPEEIKDLDVTVFSSHRHPDHFTREIFNWRTQIPRLTYVLSDDIRISDPLRGGDILFVHPGKEYTIDNTLSLRTLRSTDTGVAFVINADGMNLYHAGDLNWWHWEGEPPHWNNTMAANYKRQIDLLKGKTFDIAFVPLDPRLKKSYLLGMDYFLRNTDAEAVFPMHFGEDYSVFKWLQADERAAEYRGRIQVIERRGQHFIIE